MEKTDDRITSAETLMDQLFAYFHAYQKLHNPPSLKVRHIEKRLIVGYLETRQPSSSQNHVES